jgi:AraC family transcriptional regulator, dual regulator of chb operon
MRRIILQKLLSPGMWAHYAHVRRNYGVPQLHTHDFHEVCWVEGGSGAMLSPKGSVPLASGDLLLINAEDQHGFVDDPGGLLLTNLAFSVVRWNELVARYRPGDDPMRWPAARRKRRLGSGELRALRLACDDLDQGRRDRLAAERLLVTLFAVLREAPSQTVMPDWLGAGCRAVEQGRWRSGTSALVAASGRSREHVARVCRAVLGKSPIELVTELRLSHLAKRLVESDVPIAALVEEIGLSNLAHVYRLFRRVYGVSPGTWRKRHRLVMGG